MAGPALGGLTPGGPARIRKKVAFSNIAHARGLAPPPACWINTLPYEIKIQIDPAAAEGATSDQPFWRINPGPADFAAEYGPRTVDMLFGVSRRWSALCAPMFFESITPRQGEDYRFRLDIAQRRGCLVRTFEADKGSNGGQIWRVLIGILPLMPNLSHVILRLVLMPDFLDDERNFHITNKHTVQERSMLQAAAWRALAGCERITLRLTGQFVDDSLREYHLNSPVPVEERKTTQIRLELDNDSWLAILPKLLSFTGELDTLEIDFAITADQHLDHIGLFAIFPNLRHFKATLRRVAGHSLAPFSLADAHCATLETLDICICGVSSGANSTILPAFTQHHPNLKRLILTADATLAPDSLGTSILDSITALRFPRLTHLILDGLYAPDADDSTSGLDELINKSELVFRSEPVRRNHFSATPRLVGYCGARSRSLDTKCGQEYLRLRRVQMQAAAGNAADPRDALEQADDLDFSPGGPLLRELEDTVEYLVDRVQHAKRIGDRTALSELAERVREVAREKWIMEA